MESGPAMLDEKVFGPLGPSAVSDETAPSSWSFFFFLWCLFVPLRVKPFFDFLLVCVYPCFLV